VTATTFVSPQDLSAIAALLKHTHAHVESQVHGGSMGATLPPGARIRLSCRETADYRPGDVVVYVQGSGLVAHRLVGRGRGARARGYLITRGDASATCDPPVPIERAVGLVTEWRRADAETWQQVGPPTYRSGLGALVATADHAMVGALLELHPPLARAGAILARRLHGVIARLRGVPNSTS
jgi:hypothetical protein